MILESEASAEAAALLETVSGEAPDLPVAWAIGWWHWFRFEALRPGEGDRDLSGAFRMLKYIYAGHPESVPRPIRAYFDAAGGETWPAGLSLVAARIQGHLDRVIGGDHSGELLSVIELLRLLLRVTPSTDEAKLSMLSNLAVALINRFTSTGRTEDLNEALCGARQALSAAPLRHPHRGAILSNLSGVLAAGFERTGRVEYLEEAIRVARDAVADTPTRHPNRARYVSGLVGAIATGASYTGQRADLDEAIRLGRGVVAAVPFDHPDRAGLLSNLGGALITRFAWTFERSDLDEAISVAREAVERIPPGHPARPAFLSNLGGFLETRFQWTADLVDVNQAIDANREALAVAALAHPDRARYMFNLSVALRDRFVAAGDLPDIDEAISLGRETMAGVPEDQADRAKYLSNLARAVQIRSDHSGDPAELDDAIRIGWDVLAVTAPVHPDRTRYLSYLGVALRERFGHSKVPEDLNDAIRLGREAVAIETASPRMSAIAARELGRSLALGKQWQEAVPTFTMAIELLGQVASRSLTRGSQERLLEDFDGLASEAAACCIHAGLIDQAVELFEQGRGVLLAQALDMRTDLTALTDRYPELAERFITLRDELAHDDDSIHPQKVSVVSDHTVPAHLALERRRELVRGFDRALDEIRARPGFDRFLRPHLIRELAAAAADGPVVLINVSQFGSHALILTRDGIAEPLALDELTPDSVTKVAVRFLAALQNTPTQTLAERLLVAVLGWLWEALAGPVLDRLDIRGPPSNGTRWPRVWWCTAGMLSFLPLHAAGYHETRDDAVPATVIDRVISSYTPTLRALVRARVETGNTTAARRVLVVAMPKTPGAPDLPGAEDEAAVLRRRFPDWVTMLTGAKDAKRAAVLAALSEVQWAHFACHASSNLQNPSASYLLLSDHEELPLSLLDIAGLRLHGAQLAFLSACSTGRPGRFSDEAIHLASVFQLAGYRHVIATLWPIYDRSAVILADDFYAQLVDPIEGLDAAAALHAATRELRERWVSTPSAWASHIHSGS